MKILDLPLTNSFFVTIFNGYKNATYHVTKQGNVTRGTDALESDFLNRRILYGEHLMYGQLSELTEAKAKKIFESAEIAEPFPDYTDLTKTLSTALESFKSFLISNNWQEDEELTWIIVPKPSKKLTGQKILMEFKLCTQEFKPNKHIIEELEVFMTPITKTSKSLKFSVRIPKYIYDKYMTDAVVEDRPQINYIETDTIATLHDIMADHVNHALKIEDIETSAQNAKKLLCINFSSSEAVTRDDFNHAYTGQRININFNFFVAYKIVNPQMFESRTFFTYKKYKSGFGLDKRDGIKGIMDTEAQGHRHWLLNNPKVFMDWTQEREDFLTLLEVKFRNLSNELNSFLDNLNEDKIELLMANNNLKLLGN